MYGLWGLLLLAMLDCGSLQECSATEQELVGSPAL